MSGLLNLINRETKPLVDEIDEYMKRLDVGRLGTFYDADWGGIPTHLVVDKICERMHGKKPKSHWITYAYAERPIKYAKESDFQEICFLEYEPHENEIREICNNKKTIGIFGHHKDRNDIRELCNRDFRFSYFNPRDFSRDIEAEYERGVPILYPFVRLAEKYGIDAEFIGLLGLRGYGYKKLYDEMLGLQGWEKKKADGKFDEIIDNVNLLTGYNLDNCKYVVKRLSEAKSFDSVSIREMNRLCVRSKLPEKKNRAIGRAIIGSKIIGDVQIFPIKTDFETIKPLVGELNDARKNAELFTTVCVQYMNPNSRKVSIRTDRNISIPELLEYAHEGFENKNFGGHPKSGGFVSAHDDMKGIFEKFLNSYFLETGQKMTVAAADLSFLSATNGWWD